MGAPGLGDCERRAYTIDTSVHSDGRKARLSSGAAVVNSLEFHRLAELHFASHDAYDAYIEWFQAHVIPPPRTPAGKSAFKFYLISEGEIVERC